MPTPSRRALALASLSFLLLSCSKSASPGADGGPSGALTAPADLVATASTSALAITLTWTAESAAAGGYQIYRTDIGQLDTSTTSRYVDSSVSAGTSYSYTVRAVDASGDVSGDSNSATAITIPPAPSGLTATSITSTSITITWTEAMGATGGDEVSYVTGHTAPVTAGATGTSYTASDLIPDSSYTFTVTARDATGPGPAATDTFTTLAGAPPGDGGSGDAGNPSDGGSPDDAGNPDDAGPPDAGSGADGAFNLTAYGADSLILLQWDDQGMPSYQIFRAHGSSTDYALIGTSAVDSFVDLGGDSHPLVTGDSYTYYVVPVDDTGAAQPSSSASTTRAFGIAVHEADRYLDDTSSAAYPADYSNGVTTLALGESYQLIPAYPDGGLDTQLGDAIASYGTTNGYAVFPGVPTGPALLYGDTPRIYSFLPATTRALELSTSVAGRSTEETGDDTLSLHLSMLDPWDVNDDALQAVGWGAEDSTYPGPSVDTLLTDTPLADGGTDANGTLDSSSMFSSAGLLDAAQGDVLYFLQQETDSSATPYTAARKSFSTSVTFTDGASTSVTGEMIGTPSISQALTVTRDPQSTSPAFLSYVQAVNPAAAAGGFDVNNNPDYGATVLGAEPGYSTDGSYGLSIWVPQLWFGDYQDFVPFAPQLVIGKLPSGTGNVSFGAGGTLQFNNPFPAHWDLYLTTYVPYTVELSAAGIGEVPVTGRIQTQGLLSSYVSGAQATIGPQVSPVQSPEIDGAPAYSAENALQTYSATQPLVFSWSAPALGAPTIYTVSIWAMSSSALTGAPAATLQTATLSATLPFGYLDSGVPYVAFITATVSDVDRFSSGVLAYDINASSADCITAPFAVQ